MDELGRLSPPFLYSFSLLSKTATSSLFVVHLTEISPSTSEKHRFLQYSSPANHDSQPYSARYIPSFGGAWGGPSPLSFIPLHYYIKRQLPHSLPSISLKYPLQQVKYIALSSTHHQQTTTPNLTPPGTSPPSEGLGEAALSFFKYFRPLPHLLSNIENMSTLFSVKIPFFCPSLQQLMLQSTNSLLFICFLLSPLILSSSLSSDVYSLPVSPDHYSFL